MREALLLLIVLFTPYNTISAQVDNSVKIEGNTSPYYEGKTIILTAYRGEGIILEDSTKVKNNSFSFNTGEYLEKVSYISVTDNDYPRNVSFILEKGVVKMYIDTMDTQLSNTPINNSFQKYRDSGNTYFNYLFKEYRNITNKTQADTLELLSKLDKHCDFSSKLIVENIDNALGMYIFNAIGYACHDSIFDRTLKEISEKKPLNESILEVINGRNRKALIGTQFKDLILVTDKGKITKLSDFIGSSNFMYLDFWASWCGPCLKEMPHLKEIHDKYSDKGLKIIGISLDKDENVWLKSLKKNNLNAWLQCIGMGEKWNSEARSKYRISGIPYGVLMDRNGIIINVDIDANKWDYPELCVRLKLQV